MYRIYRTLQKQYSSLGLEDLPVDCDNIRSFNVCIPISVVVTKTRTAISIKDIVRSAILNTSTVFKKHNISDQRTRAASAAIVSATSTVVNDDKYKCKELLSHLTDSNQSAFKIEHPKAEVSRHAFIKLCLNFMIENMPYFLFDFIYKLCSARHLRRLHVNEC